MQFELHADILRQRSARRRGVVHELTILDERLTQRLVIVAKYRSGAVVVADVLAIGRGL